MGLLTVTVLRWTSEGYLEALIATADEAALAEPFEAIELQTEGALPLKGNRVW